MKFHDPFIINWWFSLDNTNWESIGTTETPVYVTYKPPNGPIYLTTIHIGTKYAPATPALTPAGEVTVADAIYGHFQGKQVDRADGTRLTFWGGNTVATGAAAGDTAGLIQNLHGACDAWSNFLIDVWKDQGITGAIAREVQSTTAGEGMMTWAWKTVRPPSASGPYNYLLLVDVIMTQNSEQGSVMDSPHIWLTHFMVQFNGKCYDPSYGTVQGGYLAWENQVFSGFTNGTVNPTHGRGKNGLTAETTFVVP